MWSKKLMFFLGKQNKEIFKLEIVDQLLSEITKVSAFVCGPALIDSLRKKIALQSFFQNYGISCISTRFVQSETFHARNLQIRTELFVCAESKNDVDTIERFFQSSNKLKNVNCSVVFMNDIKSTLHFHPAIDEKFLCRVMFLDLQDKYDNYIDTFCIKLFYPKVEYTNKFLNIFAYGIYFQEDLLVYHNNQIKLLSSTELYLNSQLNTNINDAIFVHNQIDFLKKNTTRLIKPSKRTFIFEKSYNFFRTDNIYHRIYMLKKVLNYLPYKKISNCPILYNKNYFDPKMFSNDEKECIICHETFENLYMYKFKFSVGCCMHKECMIEYIEKTLTTGNRAQKLLEENVIVDPVGKETPLYDCN